MAGRFTAKAISNWILDRYAKDGRPCDQLMIHKLVYIYHGWYLALLKDGPGLIADPVLAWKYGPVIPAIRKDFRDFGSDPITSRAKEWIGADEFYLPHISHFDVLDWEVSFLEWAYSYYRSHTGVHLIELTHKEDSPWSLVTSQGKNVHNQVIPVPVIREHYCGLLNNLRHNSR